MIQTLFILLFSVALNAKTLNGIYEVPVSDLDLKSASLFDMQKVKVKQSKETLTIKYTFPSELIGREWRAEFSGPFENGHGVLTSGEHQMNCQLTEKSNLNCHVQFNHLVIDQENAKKIMATKFKDEELEKKLLVQQGFSTDPVGIVRLKLK